jgi:hypothetical protein
MVIADNQLDPAEARFLEGGQEGSPVDLRLAECGSATEDAALSIQTDAGGDEDGAADDLAPNLCALLCDQAHSIHLTYPWMRLSIGRRMRNQPEGSRVGVLYPSTRAIPGDPTPGPAAEERAMFFI